jgi:hypothetical protein
VQQNQKKAFCACANIFSTCVESRNPTTHAQQVKIFLRMRFAGAPSEICKNNTSKTTLDRKNMCRTNILISFTQNKNTKGRLFNKQTISNQNYISAIIYVLSKHHLGNVYQQLRNNFTCRHPPATRLNICSAQPFIRHTLSVHHTPSFTSSRPCILHSVRILHICL